MGKMTIVSVGRGAEIKLPNCAIACHNLIAVT